MPCERPAQDALPAFHDPAGIVDVLWLCGPCAEDTAAHSGPRTRSQPPLEEPHEVWYRETCDACGEGDLPIDTKDQPPKTPRRRRKRSESLEHSPEYVSAKKNQSTPGSNYLTTPRPIRGAPRNRECILKGCSLRAEEGTCRNTGEPKLACTRAHYLRHKKETPSRSETEGNQTQGLERDTSPSIRTSGRETTSHWKRTVVYPGGGRLLWAIIG